MTEWFSTFYQDHERVPSNEDIKSFAPFSKSAMQRLGIGIGSICTELGIGLKKRVANRDTIPKHVLQFFYIHLKYSVYEIGKELDVYTGVITRSLKYHKLNRATQLKSRPAVTNTYAYQKARGLERKLKLVEMLGGCCSECGYKKNLAAFDFHHKEDKSFRLDMRSLSNRKFELCVAEAQKCILLCSNCHREHHNPDYVLTKRI